MLTQTSRETDFPWIDGRVYLNTAAEGMPPKPVIDAIHQYARDKLLCMDGRALHEVQWGAMKRALARAYGLSEEEVTACSCTSQAFNLLGSALKFGAGDEVVINDLDYPSGATTWFHANAAAAVEIWRHREWSLRVEDLVPLLTPRTRLVQLSMVSFFNGCVAPLRQVVDAVHKHSGALISVDVTQALGRIPLDLAGVDFIVSSTHKWICASHGGGLVGIRKARAAQLTAPAGGWFNLRDPFGPDRFKHPAENLPGAASFTPGLPNYGSVYPIRAALDYIHSVGVEKIHAHAAPLVRHCLAGIKKLPVELITPDEPDRLAGILSFRHPESQRIERALHARNIHVMHHAGRIRISIHGYNTPADVDALLSALTESI